MRELFSDSVAEAGFVGVGGELNAQFGSSAIAMAQLAVPIDHFGYSSLGDRDHTEWQFYLSIKKLLN